MDNTKSISIIVDYYTLDSLIDYNNLVGVFMSDD